MKTTFPFPLMGILAATLLAGCGFHPRGDIDLPEGISSIQVQGPAYLVDELVVLLESNDIVTGSNEPDAILVVKRETFDKRTLSVESETGKERERVLMYAVVYHILATDGTELLPEQTVKLTRDYVFDEAAVIGTRREGDILHREMRREAATRIIRRLGAWRP